MIFRIIIVIIIVLLAIPLVNKGKEYWEEKVAKIKLFGESAEKTIRYSIGGSKEK